MFKLSGSFTTAQFINVNNWQSMDTQDNPQIGYYVCNSASNADIKEISANTFMLKNGGCFHVKMVNIHISSTNPMLNVNSTGAKKLYYRENEASKTNCWESGEVLEVYFDNSADNGNGAYYANKVGGNFTVDESIIIGGKGFLTNDTVAKKFRSIYNEYSEQVNLSVSEVKYITYIPVEGTTIYMALPFSTNTAFTLRFYSNNSVIGTLTLYTNNINEVTIPGGCNKIALYIGSTQVSETEVLNIKIYEGTLQETNNNIESLSKEFDESFTQGNLFDKTKVKIGVTLNTSGTEISNSSYFVSDFIPVISGANIIASRYIDGWFGSVAQFDSNKVFISHLLINSVNGVSLDATAAYIRIGEAISNIDKVFVYYGSNTFNKRKSHNKLNSTIDENSLVMSGIYKEESISKNLYNPNTLFKGISLGSDGTLTINTNYSVSDKIIVDPLVYYYTNISGCVYDVNDNVIDYFNSSANRRKIKIPENGSYVRLNVRYTDTPVFLRQDSNFITGTPSPIPAFIGRNFINSERLNLPLIKDYCKDDLNQDFFAGKKLAVDGDSITHDQGSYNYWQYVVANNLKMQLVSSTFTYNSTTYTIGNRGISGSRIAFGTEENTKPYCISARYDDLPSDVDVIIIAGGTNDWAHSGVQLGTMTDRTNTTFYGALHVLCLGLINKYPSKTIIFMTPIKRGNLGATNNIGKTLEEYADAIIEVCGYYGIPVIDMFRNCMINPSIPSQQALYFDDDTHPNTAGQYKMGTLVTGKLKTLV